MTEQTSAHAGATREDLGDLAVVFLQTTIARIKGTHDQILRLTEEHSATELCQSFGPTAPPIGWHIWHLIRWADRLQATLPNGTDIPDPDNGIWQQQQLVVQWGLDPTTLGLFESGLDMSFDHANALPAQVEKPALVGYVRAVVAHTVELLDGLDLQMATTVRPSVRDFYMEQGKPVVWPNRRVDVFADLSFLLSHSTRHWGMIEALGGLLH